MDIIEELDLPIDDVPDSFEFSLDDILEEYGTLGLVSEDARYPGERPESDIEARFHEERDDDLTPRMSQQQNIPDSADGGSFGDPFGLGDILSEFATPTDDDGVKLYCPASASDDTDDDGVRVYTPGSAADASDEQVPAVSPESADATIMLPAIDSEEGADPTIVMDAATDEDMAHIDELVLVDEILSGDTAALDPIPEVAAAAATASAKKKKLSWKEKRALKKQERAAKKAAKKQAKADKKAGKKPASEVPAQAESPTILPSAEEQTAELFAELEAEQLLAQQQAEEEARQEALMEEELFDWIASTTPQQEEETVSEEPVEVPEYIPEHEVPKAKSAFPGEDEDLDETQFILMEQDATEDSDLLENTEITPDDLKSAEESPEDAARKKQEDEDLRYVPEPTAAKAISSAVGKRFGNAFAAFTQPDEDSERDLGEEIAPSKATNFYNQHLSGYRTRLHFAVILCVLVGWISLGLPVFGSLRNTTVAALACLCMQLIVMFLGADIFAVGLRGIVRRTPGAQSLVSISCIASILDAVIIVLSHGEGGYLPFCGISAISMCFAIYGSLLYCRAQRMNFRVLEQCPNPMTISVDYGIVDEETTTAYRTEGHPEEFIHRSEEEDLSETVFSMISPLIIVAIPVLSLIAALLTKSMGNVFHYMAGMYAAAAPFSALLAFPLPYLEVEKELYRTKSSIAGWTGTKELGRVSTMIVTDKDLFPDETVSIGTIRIVDKVPEELTISYLCSLIIASGSCLVPAFQLMADKNDCELFDVENFQCHEAGGLSGDIGPDHVLVACHSYMKLNGLRIPARKKESENALFLTVNGHVIAYVVVDYKPVKSVKRGLEAALNGSAEMIFAARDFNITPLLISKKFKSPTDCFRFPSYRQRYEITTHNESETATCAAVVSRKSFYPYAIVLEKARNLYKSVTMTVGLSVLSCLVGVVLVFAAIVLGLSTQAFVGRLLIFMLLWLIPTIVISVSITK